MMKNFHLYILTFILLISIVTSAQQGEQVTLRLESVLGKGVTERLYVHTDKSTYMAGDILWFKIYSIDAALHRPLELSKIAYLDILDKNNIAVVQAKVAMDTNANGSIQLPLSLTSGNYKLRCYTSWMKNQGAETYFEQVVTIINPLKNPEVEQQGIKPAHTAVFFPEGGNLVQGLESRLAFKLTDAAGKGVEGSGAVISSSGDTVSTFITHKFGIGSFTFRPREGQSYNAHITLSNGRQFTQPLPPALQEGYTMGLTEEKEGVLKIKVQSSGQGQEGRPVYLLIHTRGMTKVSDHAIVANGTAVFNVEKTRLAEGVSQLTIFTHQGQPVCERLYFWRPSVDHVLTAQSDGAQYNTRSKVSVAIQNTGKDGNAAPATLSLSVYRLDSLQLNKRVDIQSYLWLTSELSGMVESPEYYLSDTNPEMDKATDLLMLTHGWRRLNWKNATSRAALPVFPPEYNGHMITVRVTDSRTGAPASGVPVFLSIPGQYFSLSSSNSDAQGLARFDVKDVYGPVELYLQTNTPKENYYKFEVLTPFSNQYTTGAWPSLQMPPYLETLETNSIAMQVQNVYHGDSLRHFTLPLLRDTLPFYGKGDYTYALDDYTRFTTMEEVLREYVRFINVSLRGGKLYLSMFDENLKVNFEENLLLMVDGVPLVDKNRIFDYDPRKVKRLDIIPRGYLFGPHYFRGVASFTTYAGNLEGLTLDPRILMVNYEGPQLQREFYAPVYMTADQKNSRIPDFRTTLLWKPDIVTGEKGSAALSFYTSDHKGQYIGVLQGIDKEGRPASASFTFIVQ
jgi:hypothetical protein